MSFKVRPFLGMGSWTTSYYPYYRFAYAAHAEFLLAVTKIDAEEQRLRLELEISEFPKENREDYIHHLMSNLHHDAYRAATSCHIYACMTLEGFINLYGVKRLGQDFYQRNLERLGITEKLAVIGACCGQWDLDDHPHVIRDFRELFDARNRLVHPKSRKLRIDRLEDHLYVHPSKLEITSHMQRLERCVDFFVAVDGTLHRDFLFSKVDSRNETSR